MEDSIEYIKKFTLIFVKNGENVLLGLKKRGFGEGKWNGFGGKVEKNETILNGAIRELKEESNLEVKKIDMKYLGYVQYERNDTKEIDIVYIFTTSKVSDSFQESEEMKPQWFKFEDIPYDRMWPDSKYWLPIALKDQGLLAKFFYSSDNEIVQKIVDQIEVPELIQ